MSKVKCSGRGDEWELLRKRAHCHYCNGMAGFKRNEVTFKEWSCTCKCHLVEAERKDKG